MERWIWRPFYLGGPIKVDDKPLTAQEVVSTLFIPPILVVWGYFVFYITSLMIN